MNGLCEILAASLIAAVPWSVTTAAAAPIPQSMGLHNASVKTVNYHRARRSGHRGGSAGIGAGAGRILRTTRPYGYYGYGPGYAYPPLAGYAYPPLAGYAYPPLDGYVYPPGGGYAYRPGHPYEFDRQLSGRT
jgi:hypothetical protein